MIFLEFLFKKKQISLTHEEVKEKTSAIMEGSDTASQTIHDDKNRYTRDLLKLEQKSNIIRKKAEKLTRDTAYHIAIATGASRRGYAK